MYSLNEKLIDLNVDKELSNIQNLAKEINKMLNDMNDDPNLFKNLSSKDNIRTM